MCLDSPSSNFYGVSSVHPGRRPGPGGDFLLRVAGHGVDVRWTLPLVERIFVDVGLHLHRCASVLVAFFFLWGGGGGGNRWSLFRSPVRSGLFVFVLINLYFLVWVLVACLFFVGVDSSSRSR